MIPAIHEKETPDNEVILLTIADLKAKLKVAEEITLSRRLAHHEATHTWRSILADFRSKIKIRDGECQAKALIISKLEAKLKVAEEALNKAKSYAYTGKHMLSQAAQKAQHTRIEKACDAALTAIRSAPSEG